MNPILVGFIYCIDLKSVEGFDFREQILESYQLFVIQFYFIDLKLILKY